MFSFISFQLLSYHLHQPRIQWIFSCALLPTLHRTPDCPQRKSTEPHKLSSHILCHAPFKFMFKVILFIKMYGMRTTWLHAWPGSWGDGAVKLSALWEVPWQPRIKHFSLYPTLGTPFIPLLLCSNPHRWMGTCLAGRFVSSACLWVHGSRRHRSFTLSSGQRWAHRGCWYIYMCVNNNFLIEESKNPRSRNSTQNRAFYIVCVH